MTAGAGEGQSGIVTELEVLADEGGPDYAAYLTTRRHVTLTAPLRTWLASSRAEGRPPILVTGDDAVLGPHVVTAMRLSGGSWAVRTGDGVYDGLGGGRIHAFADLHRPRDPEEHPAYTRIPRPERAAILVEVIVSRRADEHTLIGPLAEAVVTALGGATPDRWGLEEPLSRAFDHGALTASMRAQMPVSEPHLMGSPDGSYAAVSVGRTQHGLIERVRAGIPVGGLGEVPHADLARAVGDVMLELQQHTQMVVAFGSVAPVVDLAQGLAQRPGRRQSEQPLALLFGPRAARELQLDMPEMAKRFDLTTVGRARTPSVLLRTRDDKPWRTLADFFAAVEPERVAAALGLDSALLAHLVNGPRAAE